jgi:dTDP-4-amino-4,6-dideoxygalactose transaminase/acetyltransferase-like isoleucine patch superfamily enzyme
MKSPIHHSAIIDEGAVIGTGTHIWHFTHVCAGARVGSGCSLGQNVFVANDVNIGNNVKIQNNVSIYDAVTLEDDVFCGPSMVFTNVYNPRSAVTRKHEYRSTLVRRGATIGANATIVCGVTIGEYAFIGAGAVVNHDIPAFALVVGVPARQIGWISRHGDRLSLPLVGNAEARCEQTSDLYALKDGVCTLVTSRLTEHTPKFPELAEWKTMEFIDLKSQYQESRDLINQRIQAVLDHGQYIMGPEVGELEARLAEYCEVRHCVTVSSGTEALIIALMALGIGPGDEVITTPFSFIATAEAIVLVGAKPVFVDIDLQTCNIDSGAIEEAITARTRAIMPVSLYGQPASMDAINRIARKYELPVIEDAAQSFGSTYRGRKSCGLSTIGCTSFFPSKPLGCYGDGGALFTNDDALAKAAREIRVHGQSERYVHTRIGVGGRMDTLQCAIVLAKLDRFDDEVAQRAKVATHYDALLSGKVGLVKAVSECSSVYAQYTVVVENRESVQAILKDAGIPTAVHYPVPIHRQPAYALFALEADCPNALEMAKKVMSLPMGPYLTLSDVKHVAEVLIRATAVPVSNIDEVLDASP